MEQGTSIRVYGNGISLLPNGLPFPMKPTAIMFTRAAVLTGILALASARAFAAQGSKEAPSYVQPAENLVLIVADLQRRINDDIYRFAVPTDVTGQNIFRVSAARLANYMTLYPGKMVDLASMAMGQAFEKLGDYGIAGANYEKAKSSSDPRVAKAAQENLNRAARFAGIVNKPVSQVTLQEYENDIKQKVADFDKLIGELKGSPYQSQAFLERERLQLQLAQFYVAMRFMQPYTTETALKQLKSNLEANLESKNRYLHHLLLADFHYALAREYTLLHDPDGAEFSLSAFEAFTDPARAEYRIVEQADGYPEKLEARAKMSALEAFVENVTERAR